MSNDYTKNEPPSLAAVKAMLQVCNKYAALFRIAPRPEYLANIAQRLTEDRFSTAMAEFMFEQAARLHDHYPSLAQLNQIAQDFRVRQKFSPPPPPVFEEPQERSTRQTPWPIMLELYCENRSKALNNSGQNLLKRCLQLTDEELQDLQSLYEAKDFEHPLAKHIIEKRWGETGWNQQSPDALKDLTANW